MAQDSYSCISNALCKWRWNGLQLAQRHKVPDAVADQVRRMLQGHACLQLARQNGAAFLRLYLNCPLQLALARNTACSVEYKVPDALIDQIHHVLQEYAT